MRIQTATACAPVHAPGPRLFPQRSALTMLAGLLILTACGQPTGDAPAAGDADVTHEAGEAATTGATAPVESPSQPIEQTPDAVPTANETQQAAADQFLMPRLGSADSELTIYEFSDYRCPYCRQWAEQTKPLLYENYIANDGPVSLVFVDFPLSSHGFPAVISAEAAHCASESGKYWDLHDEIFGHFGDMHDLPIEEEQPSIDYLVELASELDIDSDAMRECLETQRFRPIVASQYNRAREQGVELTPTFLIGQEVVLGALSFEDMQPYIERGLSRARGTVVPTFTPPTTPVAAP
jgi:protein-disulfide isomerase